MTIDADPERLAVFIQEYIRREQQPDAGVLAVIAADLRDPQWLPHHVAELLLARSDIRAAIIAAREFYKPPEIKQVTAHTLLADAETVFQKAKDDRQYTAALAAKRLQADLLGLSKSTVDINITHRVEDMSTAQLMKIATAGEKETIIDTEFTEIVADS